jgi:hypothetical protein
MSDDLASHVLAEYVLNPVKKIVLAVQETPKRKKERDPGTSTRVTIKF